MRKLLFVTVVLVSMAMLVSCASPTPATVIQTVEVPVVQTQVIKETQVVVVKETQVVPTTAPVAEGPVEIAVIVKTGNSSFWQNVQTGAIDAQKELQGADSEALGHLPRRPVREQHQRGDQHRRERDRPRRQGDCPRPLGCDRPPPGGKKGQGLLASPSSSSTRNSLVTRPTMCHSSQPTTRRRERPAPRR